MTILMIMIHAIEVPEIEQRIGAYNNVHAASFRNEVTIYLAGFKPDQRVKIYGGTYIKGVLPQPPTMKRYDYKIADIVSQTLFPMSSGYKETMLIEMLNSGLIYCELGSRSSRYVRVRFSFNI